MSLVSQWPRRRAPSGPWEPRLRPGVKLETEQRGDVGVGPRGAACRWWGHYRAVSPGCNTAPWRPPGHQIPPLRFTQTRPSQSTRLLFTTRQEFSIVARKFDSFYGDNSCIPFLRRNKCFLEKNYFLFFPKNVFSSQENFSWVAGQEMKKKNPFLK